MRAAFCKPSQAERRCAGPVEATAIGNVMMQMIGTNNLDSVAAGRVLVQKSFDTQPFKPQNPDAWTEPASRFAKL